MAGTDAPTTQSVPVSKLRPPRVRHAELTRAGLLGDDRLSFCDVLTICAPAGYGKSTLAIQWASRADRAIAWATLDESDNDPVVLLLTLTAAVDHALGGTGAVGPVSAEEPAFTREVIPRFLSTVASTARPLTLVIDDVHHIEDRVARRILKALVDAVPPGSQVAFVGRDMAAIPLPLWRGQGRTVELRADDLCFRADETLAALRAFHCDADETAVHLATAGWPVAVFLLSQAPEVRSTANIAEFIEAEVLAPQPTRLRDFVLATASLGAVNFDLARVVTGDEDSGEHLAHGVSTVLLSANGDGWYQFHPLMTDCAIDVLRREDPQRLSDIRARAAMWHLEHGHPDTAVSLAIASGDGPTMGTVVWSAARVALLHGRTRSVEDWLAGIGPKAIDRVPGLSMTAAWTNVAAGHYGEVVRHGEQTLTLMPDDWLTHPADFAIGPALALLIGATHLGVSDSHEALQMAQVARRHIGPTEPLSALASVVLGVDLALVGDPQALTVLTDAAAIAAASSIASTQAEAHAMLGLALLAAGDDSAGSLHAQRAIDVVSFHDLVDMTSTSGVVALADVALSAVSGDTAHVLAAMNVQATMRDEVSKVLAWYHPLSGGVLAFACARVGDLDGYRSYRSWCGDAGGLVGAWRTRADQQAAASTPLMALTPAELRVWELLKSRMTLNEIAGALFLSRETVKSHTGSIYRKLGVSSRREAQDLADRW